MIDFSVIVTMLASVWWLFGIIILLLIIRTPWFKGVVGEWIVNFWAKLDLPANKYIRFYNVTLNTPEGTTQIDHVFVSRYGIFCVETKNMTGWIFGSERDRQWTQKIFRHTTRFQNPLRQNYKHTKALEELLGVPRKSIHSVIVFTGDATFKTDMPANVVYAGGYTRHIKSFREIVFTAAEVNRVCETINANRLKPSWKTNRTHVRNLKKRMQNR